ncbi:MAG TPA: penicillin acylase family protein [Gemmata sp.]|nr:penicillin acylase family protein [Gemmata sp.]
MGLSRLLLRLSLGRRLPITSGELRVRGPSAPVTIRRDHYGIPHIDAQSEANASFALGFCQGQDRAGQLEVTWRLGRGRLAEWVGERGLAVDRMSRRIGFRRAAEKQVAALAAGPLAQVTAFAVGLNAGRTIGLSKKPHEFAILGGEPSNWDAIDVLTFLKLLSFTLPSNWDVELARLRILLADGPDALLAVDPNSSAADRQKVRGDVAADSTDKLSLSPLVADLAALQAVLPRGGGSNNWVIAGSRTASGKPILASDPHLAPSAPPPWYLAHIRCPEWEAAGAMIVGAPGIGIGHNGFAAWGVTAGLTDNSDFFIETLGTDAKSVRESDGSFTRCEVVREVIRVKDGQDVVEDVLITPRGPIISPVVPDVPLALSLRAVWLDPLPVCGFLDMLKARSFEEFRRPFEDWPLLPLNLVYADTSGAVGYQLIGQLPRRNDGHGLLPRPADAPRAGWDGLVPFDEMPHATSFAQGYYATANNPPTVPAVGSQESGVGQERASELNPDSRLPIPDLGSDFCDEYRVRSIRDTLAARDGWTVEDCLELQRDFRSIPWEEIRDVMLAIPTKDQDAQEAIDLLREWDGRVDSESPCACIFELFTAEMCVRAAKVKAPKSWLAAVGEMGLGIVWHTLFTDRRVGHLVKLLREQPAGWFDSWHAEMESVLAEVVKKLRREVGPAPAFWAWGHLRQLRLEHPLFGKHPWLGPAFNLGPMPVGGDCNTISQAGVRPAEPTAYTHNMANMRTVFDLADLSKSQFVLCGGQSGNPLSRHHADQLPLWQAGESIPIPWLQAEVIRATRDVLRLLPEGRQGPEALPR